MTLFLVSLAGGLGAMARFVVDGFLATRNPLRIPLGTFAINVTGSLVLGVLAGWILYGGGGGAGAGQLKSVVGTGFCGGFTTFSTACVESVRLTFAQGWQRGIGYAVLTLVGAALAAALGLWLGSLAG